MSDAAVASKKKQGRRVRGQQLQIQGWNDLGTAELEEKVIKMEKTCFEQDINASKADAPVFAFGTKLNDIADEPKETELCIGNLPYNATAREVRLLFEGVKFVNLLYDNQGKMKGYGSVEFHNMKDAQKALKLHNKIELKDRLLKIELRSLAEKENVEWKMPEKAQPRQKLSLGLYTLREGDANEEGNVFTAEKIDRNLFDTHTVSSMSPLSRRIFSSKGDLSTPEAHPTFTFGTNVQKMQLPGSNEVGLSRKVLGSHEIITSYTPIPLSRDNFLEKFSPSSRRSKICVETRGDGALPNHFLRKANIGALETISSEILTNEKKLTMLSTETKTDEALTTDLVPFMKKQLEVNLGEKLETETQNIQS